MSGWTPKRFWKAVTVEPAEGGFGIRLDGRAVKTPSKAPLVVPTEAMAREIAAEWQAQDGVVKPETMPWTRAANSAIDKVTPQFDEVAGMLAAYGASDLLCYRAAHPPALAESQAAAWDPVLAWAAGWLPEPMVVTAGVMHVAQPPGSLACLEARVRGLTPFQLTGLHDLVALPGSLLLALAVVDGMISAQEAWTRARVDEAWQIEEWGADEEAAEAEAARRAAFLLAARFYALSG
jgi:chaperone required for assembly of F1-ATPase